MLTFFKLIRWKNLLIVALTMFAMKYFVIVPIYSFYKVEIGLPATGFLFLVASAMFLMAAGNVINDYFDRKTDMINRPQKVLIGFKIKRRQAIFMHTALNVLGVICGFIAAWFTGKLWLGLFFIVIAMLLWSYSAGLKKKILIGNILVAALTGLIPFIVGVSEYYAVEKSLIEWNLQYVHAVKISIQTIIGFAVFAFLFNLIREIIKDCEDYEGDLATGVRSIPIVIGKQYANYIISFISFSSIALILLVWHLYFSKLLFFKSDYFSAFYIYSMIIFPTAIIAISALFGTKKHKYSKLSSLSKFVMVTGVFYSLIFSIVVYASI